MGVEGSDRTRGEDASIFRIVNRLDALSITRASRVLSESGTRTVYWCGALVPKIIDMSH